MSENEHFLSIWGCERFDPRHRCSVAGGSCQALLTQPARHAGQGADLREVTSSSKDVLVAAVSGCRVHVREFKTAILQKVKDLTRSGHFKRPPANPIDQIKPRMHASRATLNKPI